MTVQTDRRISRFAQVPLATRLFAAIGLILLAGGTLVTFAALAYGQQAARDAFDRLLIGAAQQISASISVVQGELTLDLPVPALELLALAKEDRIVYRVINPDGTTLTGYEEPALPDFTGDVYYFDGTFTGEPARYAAIRRHFAERGFSGTVTTIVGHTTRARNALAWDIARNAWLLLALAGLAMVALAAFSIRSALSPLRRIEQNLLARDPNDLTPLDLSVPQELQAVVKAINRFMTRLRRQMDGMQNLISDSAHQLRTPIAALRAQAELAADETDPEKQARIVARIHQRSRDLSRLTDQILNRALVIHRADTAIHEITELRKVAMNAAETFDDGTVFETGKLRLDLPQSPVFVRGDRLSLQEAAKNFISNAFGHGRGTVTVTVTSENGVARLAVRDEGDGMPEAMRKKLGGRFVEGEGRRSGNAGIGLAIAKAVAIAHRGELEFGPAEGPGFEIALRLPQLKEKNPG